MKRALLRTFTSSLLYHQQHKRFIIKGNVFILKLNLPGPLCFSIWVNHGVFFSFWTLTCSGVCSFCWSDTGIYLQYLHLIHALLHPVRCKIYSLSVDSENEKFRRYLWTMRQCRWSLSQSYQVPVNFHSLSLAFHRTGPIAFMLTLLFVKILLNFGLTKLKQVRLRKINCYYDAVKNFWIVILNHWTKLYNSPFFNAWVWKNCITSCKTSYHCRSKKVLSICVLAVSNSWCTFTF